MKKLKIITIVIGLIIAFGITSYPRKSIKPDYTSLVVAKSTTLITAKPVITYDDFLNSDDIKSYLKKEYSILRTPIGKTEFTYDVIKHGTDERDMIKSDYSIYIYIDSDFFADLISDDDVEYEAKVETKRMLQEHEKTLACDLIQKMPNQKFDGNFTYINDGKYEYYYHWNNYDFDIKGYWDLSVEARKNMYYYYAHKCDFQWVR